MNTHRVVRVGTKALLLAIAVAVTAGCGSDGSDTKDRAEARTFVGTVQGTAAFVAVVVDGSRALAYVCDGVPRDPEGTAPSIQAWFNGPSDGRSVDVQQAAGRLRAQLTGTDLAGTLALPDGRTLAFTGKSVEGDAGLYRADATDGARKGVAGWILAADGEQRGGFGFEGTVTSSGIKRLDTALPTLTLQGLATARIARVGITPIPIP